MFSGFVLLAALAGAADNESTIIDELRSESPATIEREINVPPFGIEHQVRLSLDVRIDWKILAGSNPWIRVAINGNFLTKPDLLNKRDDFRLRSGVDLTWSKYDRWRVLYSPDFEQAKSDAKNPNVVVGCDPYQYVWNITPYVQPGKNRLRIDNLQVLAKSTTLVLRNVRLTVGRPIAAPADNAIAPAPTGPLPVFVAQTPQPIAMDVRLSAGGSIRLGVTGKTFEVHTQSSLPNGQWHATATNGEGNRVGNGEAEAAWKTDSCAIRRRVRVLSDHVDVVDTISNTTDQLLGVMIRHRLAWPEPPKQLLLGGRPQIASTASLYSAEHPSAFAVWPQLGLGLVAVDDVFRVHVRSWTDPQGMGLSDEQLGIEPGKSATLEWSIYPVPGGDYWDFVNAVRRSWGSNFTIPGPFSFTMHFRGQHPADWYGDWVRRRDLRIVCGGIAQYPDNRYAHGTGILHAPQWVAHEKDWTRKMLAAAPDVKVLAYFHAQACTEPNGETTYADARLIDAKGEHLGYPHRYRIPLYLPTRDNSYGKALWGFVRMLLDEIGTSGLYWDEMSHSVMQYAYQATWDGCTVSIDPKTHAVTGRRSSVTLLTQPLYLDIVKHVRDRNKFVMANTQPLTRTMLQQKIVRFVETGSYSAMIGTHLGCPLGLGNHHEEATHAASATNVREMLRLGGVYYGHIYNRAPADWNFTSVMFPITPVELREGMVLGEERIHTAGTGRFGWPDGSAADVYVVDGQGRRVQPAPVSEVIESGQRRYDIRMPSDHFAILAKRS